MKQNNKKYRFLASIIDDLNWTQQELVTSD